MAQTGPVDDVMLRDPYEVLGVDKGATPQEIKSACEQLYSSSHCYKRTRKHLAAEYKFPAPCPNKYVLRTSPGMSVLSDLLKMLRMLTDGPCNSRCKDCSSSSKIIGALRRPQASTGLSPGQESGCSGRSSS